MKNAKFAILFMAGIIILIPVIILVVVFGYPLLPILPIRQIVTGQVIDINSNKPLQNVLVTSEQRGWGWDDYLIWDKIYTTTAYTDINGNFSLTTGRGSVKLQAEKSGFVTFNGYYESGQLYKIPLAPENELAKKRVEELQIGVQNGSEYGWKFKTAQTVKDYSQADIWPILNRDKTILLGLETPTGLGMVFKSIEETNIPEYTINYFGLIKTPSDSFDQKQAIFTNNNERKSGICFVKMQNDVYAQIEIKSTSSRTSGSVSDKKNGTWGIMLDYKY